MQVVSNRDEPSQSPLSSERPRGGGGGGGCQMLELPADLLAPVILLYTDVSHQHYRKKHTGLMPLNNCF